MSLSKKKLLGIDIGTHALKLVRYNGGQIDSIAVTEMPDSLSRGGMISSYDACADFIKEVLNAQKIKGDDCAVVLPDGHTLLRRLNLPYMTVKQLETNLPYEFKDFLSLSNDKYFFDYSMEDIQYDELKKPATMNLLACCVQRAVIGEYRTMFKRAGLNLVGAFPVQVAYLNMIAKADLSKNDEDADFAILDLAHSCCRLDVFSGDHYSTTRIIETGLAELDRSISLEQFVDVHLAHSYKESNHKDCLNSEESRKLYNSIALDVRKAVNFYNFSNAGKKLKDLYLAGGGVFIDPLVEAIRSQAPELELHSIQDLCPRCKGNFAEISSAAAAIGAAMM